MDKDKIDRVVDAFRSAMYQEFSVEEGMVNANPGGGSGGFSGSADPKGPVAGYDHTMKLDGRNKYVKKSFIKDLMDRQQKRKDRKQRRKFLGYNPYFTPQDG